MRCRAQWENRTMLPNRTSSIRSLWRVGEWYPSLLVILPINARSDSPWFSLKLSLLLIRRCSLSHISACDTQSWSEISHAGACSKLCWLFLCIKMRTAVIYFILFISPRLLRNCQFNPQLAKDLAIWQYPIRNT